MKYLFPLLLLGCSVENVGSQQNAWYDYCKMDYKPIVSDTECSNVIHLTCLDGADDTVVAPAEGYLWIGIICYQEKDKQWFYICGINDKNQAWVYCEK